MRCDSPGSCAKYGQVTFMDVTSRKILHFELLQCSMVANSVVMEREGVRRALDSLTAKGEFIGTDDIINTLP
jgi:hypothetical protein